MVPIRNIFLHVTRACNLRCTYCYLAASEAAGDELSAAEWGRLWPEILALRPRKIVFTGGEPLLRPDLVSLIADLKSADPGHEVVRCLNTNGSRMSRELAQALVGLADEVRVSVDALAESNDRQRGAGSFEAAVRALETLYGAGFEPIAMVTVTRPALADLEDLLAFLVERRITRVHLNPFRAIGRGAAHQDWEVTPEEAGAALDRAWKRIFPSLARCAAPSSSHALNCGAGSYLNILPEGDMYPCHMLVSPPFRLGNVRDLRLEDLCGARGPLAHLQALDFRRIAAAGPRWSSLATPGACLGAVMAANACWGRLKEIEEYALVGTAATQLVP